MIIIVLYSIKIPKSLLGTMIPYQAHRAYDDKAHTTHLKYLNSLLGTMITVLIFSLSSFFCPTKHKDMHNRHVSLFICKIVCNRIKKRLLSYIDIDIHKLDFTWDFSLRSWLVLFFVIRCWNQTLYIISARTNNSVLLDPEKIVRAALANDSCRPERSFPV